MKATYGVSGMMEWVALIPTRSNLLRVRFSGGSLSGYGVTPATFSTENEVMMHIIEQSAYFRQGRIRLISKCDSPQTVNNPSPAASRPEVPLPAADLPDGSDKPIKIKKNGNRN